ncbi:MAG: ABC transporter permease [Gemmobacter sp.]
MARLGIGLVGLVLFLALAGPWLAPHDPLATAVVRALQPPSAAHWFGTDHLGRDVLSRVLHAARLDLAIAVSAAALAAVAGSLAGAAAGWAGGWVDAGMSRVVDVLLALPLFLLAMLLVLAVGNSVATVVAVTTLVNLPFFIRLVRVEVARGLAAPWVEGLRIAGAGEARILLRFVLPQVAPLIAVQASVTLGWGILNAAGLSFLGIGVRPPTAEWGIMLAEGARYLNSGQWWMAAFPAAVLVAAVLGFQLTGDALRDRAAR